MADRIISRSKEEALWWLQHHYWGYVVKANPANSADPLDRFSDLQKQGFMKRSKPKTVTLYRAMTPHGATYTGENEREAEAHVRRYGGKVEKIREQRNPATAAAEAFTEFHGHEPEELVTIRKTVHSHRHLAGAGELRALVVKPGGHGLPNRTLKGFKKAVLAFNEAKNQLYIEGGDQALSADSQTRDNGASRNRGIGEGGSGRLLHHQRPPRRRRGNGGVRASVSHHKQKWAACDCHHSAVSDTDLPGTR